MAFKLDEYREPLFSAENFRNAPEAKCVPAPKDGVAPDGYHALSIFPEYFKLGGKWLLAEESRMDCVPVFRGGKVEVIEFRRLKEGDLVICGRTEDASEGIFVHADGFNEKRGEAETFAFRQGHSRETAFSRDYDELYEILKFDKDNGKIVWVMGPAFSFDHDARNAFSRIIAGGYAHAVLAGNALATHDLEGAYLNTALGQNIYTGINQPNGHYNHLDTINKVRGYGSIKAFIEGEKIDNGIIYSLEKYGVPYVLAGSIRTMLHSIAVGNMTPSFRVLKDGAVRKVYFYCVDISEFTVNKLTDRGSLSSRGIVTNAQDFIVNIANGLGV